MTTFSDWLYLGQTQFDPDDLNKREKELAQLAWEEAQPTTPEGWQLVPIKPNNPMEAAAEDYWNGLRYSAFSKSPRTWADVYGSMLAAAPKFGEKE